MFQNFQNNGFFVTFQRNEDIWVEFISANLNSVYISTILNSATKWYICLKVCFSPKKTFMVKRTLSGNRNAHFSKWCGLLLVWNAHFTCSPRGGKTAHLWWRRTLGVENNILKPTLCVENVENHRYAQKMADHRPRQRSVEELNPPMSRRHVLCNHSSIPHVISLRNICASCAGV